MASINVIKVQYFSDSEESDPDYDSDMDPSYSILEETHGQLSTLSIKNESKSSMGEYLDMDIDIDPKDIEQIQRIIEAGKLEKLKVEQCKVYLRKNGLRLTGNKDTLIQRIREHQEILNGEGEKRYPISSFVLNCKGDACKGDVVLFEQNVYEMYSIVSRSASGPPCGTRRVAGRIVKESYGASKQQHTFTIEVLWSKGEKPLPPLHPLLIKGRNLYRLKTLRQKWGDEEARQKALMEKHSRGALARCARENRIQEKEKKKMLREQGNRKQSQSMQVKKLGLLVNLAKAVPEPPHSKPSTGGLLSEKLTFQAEVQKHWRGNKNLNQVPNNLFNNHTRIQELLQQNNNNLSEMYRHRQPLTSVNHDSLMSLQNRQGYHYQPQKLCKFYAQGKCNYGDNCKFLHDLDS